MEPTWQEPTRHTTCTQEHGGWHALRDYTPRGGKKGPIKKGAPKVWHKCRKCKNRFGIKPETKTAEGAQHQEKISGARCGGRCEGGKGCGGCS